MLDAHRTDPKVTPARGLAKEALQATLDSIERQAPEGTVALRESAAALRENEVWLAAQKEAFQAALNGSSLEASLGILTRSVVDQLGTDTDIRCAFYIADDDGLE